jgi:hypothetical protein
MLTALGRLSRTEICLVEAPALLAAWLIAEAFFKFHSFTLEAGAFLLTWMAFSSLLTAGRRVLKTDDQPPA